MIVTTTDNVPRKEIARILGVVYDSRTAWLSGKRAQERIIRELVKQAEALGADAIIGLKMELVAGGGYIGTGTAVKLKSRER